MYSDRLPGYNGLTVEVQSTSHSQRTQTELKLTKNKEENGVVFGCSVIRLFPKILVIFLKEHLGIIYIGKPNHYSVGTISEIP